MLDHKILVTGFKKFAKVDINPTELTIVALKKEIDEGLLKDVRVQALDVAVSTVDQFISEVASMPPNIVVHFGVGPKFAYSLELCCYNMCQFSVPDNHGKHYNGPIDKNCHPDAAIETKIDIKMLLNKLNSSHKGSAPVVISQDPGRYLCNYIYYTSCQKLSSNITKCLFVHFPPHGSVPHQQNVAFAKLLIQILKEQQLAQKSEK